MACGRLGGSFDFWGKMCPVSGFRGFGAKMTGGKRADLFELRHLNAVWAVVNSFLLYFVTHFPCAINVK